MKVSVSNADTFSSTLFRVEMEMDLNSVEEAGEVIYAVQEKLEEIWERHRVYVSGKIGLNT